MIVEIVWTVVALAGVVISSIGLKQSWGDLTLLRAAGVNSSRRVVARMGRRSSAARIIMQALNALVGFIALTTPNPEQNRTVRDWIVVVALVAASSLFVLAQWVDLRDRAKIERGEPAEDMGGWTKDEEGGE